MKRRLFLLALFAILLGVCTTSCKEKVKADSDITNTQWTASITNSGGVVANFLLSIKTKKKFSLTITVTGGGGMTETEQIEGTYTYTPPAPHIRFSYDNEGRTNIFTGSVTTGKITLYEAFLVDRVVLTKK